MFEKILPLASKSLLGTYPFNCCGRDINPESIEIVFTVVYALIEAVATNSFIQQIEEARGYYLRVATIS